MRKIIFLLFSIFCATNILAQSKATIKGHVLDQETDEHLPGVTILVEGSTVGGTATDDTGHFILEGVESGYRTLIIQYIGFKTTKEKIYLKPGEQKHLSIYLQEETQALNEVAVEASARSLNRTMSPVVINQLTTKTFEATNSTSLAQGLNFMPGLRVENNCQNCGTQEVRINGLQGKYSQLLVDGQAVFTSLSALYGLEQLPTNMIEEVEVIRGAGSVLQGANAVGGVINIKTKEPTTNSYEAKYTLNMIDGKSADNNASFNTSYVEKSLNSGITLFGNMRHRNPWDANGDGFSEIGKNKATSIGTRAFHKVTPHDKFTLEYHHISEFRRGGDNINRPPHEAMIAEQTDYNIDSGNLGYEHSSNDHKRKFFVNTSLQKTGRDGYFGEGKDISGYTRTDELAFVGTTRYEVNMDELLFMPAKFTVGYTHEYRNLSDSIYDRDIKQVINIGSVYAQNEWRNDDLTLMVGVRADKHAKVKGISVIPRVNGRYRIARDMNIRMSYGMGYQAPEIIGADLDIPIINGKATLTKLDEGLRREVSHSINGGIDFKLYNDAIYSYFLIEGFYTRINRVFIEEEMGEDALGNTLVLRKNGPSAYIAGVNVEASIQPWQWLDIQGGFTAQQSRYTEAVAWSSEDYVKPEKKMLRSPNFYGFLSGTATPHKSYAISLSGTYTGSMLAKHFGGAEGVEFDKTEKTKSFIDVTAKLSYFINLNSKNKLEINGGVQNIFNQIQKDYDRGPNRDSEYIYGPTLPRTYFVGIKIASI